MKKYMKLFVEAIMDPEFSQSQHVNSIVPNNPCVETNVPTERNHLKNGNEQSDAEEQHDIILTIDMSAVQEQIETEK